MLRFSTRARAFLLYAAVVSVPGRGFPHRGFNVYTKMNFFTLSTSHCLFPGHLFSFSVILQCAQYNSVNNLIQYSETAVEKLASRATN